MFFDLVKKNSKAKRKENGLFFASLIVSIIAFYIILSLKNQEVILFLKTMESDAVNRLLLITPALYGASLFILFFLVYFAGKYQLERRSHELGMYLILGMRRSKLFLMLLLEEIWNSIISLIIGIPIAIFLSEVISLITSKVVGFGIIGHKFTLSFEAVLLTIVGYFLIRIAALLILSGTIARKDIRELLSPSQEEKHRVYSFTFVTLKLLLGLLILGTAYGLAIYGYAWESLKSMGVSIFLGILGTCLLFNGLSVVFEIILKRKKKKNGLDLFTFRQLQENVFSKSNSLAISSLLILLALCSFGYGVSVSFNSSSKNRHVIDYTFTGNDEEIEREIGKEPLKDYINKPWVVKLGMIKEDGEFSPTDLIKAVEKEKDSKGKDILLNNLKYFEYPYLISLSGYNEILKNAGKESIKLNKNQVALFNGLEFSYGNTGDILRTVLKENLKVNIKGEEYELLENLYQDNIVTDRLINISYALIVSDEDFNKLIDGEYDTYLNATLKENIIKEEGLMGGILKVNKLIDKSGLKYESYLQNIGRELFYKVAASYTTIYLSLIFLIIANTVIGVQFLMQQQKTGRRYKTIVSLGGSYKELCKSARKQIKWYFSLPIIVSAFGSLFGIRALFSGIATEEMKTQITSLMTIALPTILILCVVEFTYILAVMRISDKEISKLMKGKREED